MPGDIIIRVGAALDRSVDTVFSTVEQRARRAFETTRGESAKGAAASQADGAKLVASSRQVASQQMAIEKAKYSEASKLNRLIAAEQFKTQREVALQEARLNRQRSQDRLSSIRATEREEMASETRLLHAKLAGHVADRQAARQAQREQYAASREIDRFATRTSHRATRFFFPRPEGALGYGKRLAMDIMRGAGVDLTLSGGVSRSMELEKQTTFLSNKGYFAGAQGAAGRRVDPKALAAEARSIGNRQALNPADVVESQAAYVGLTGDLETARSLMADLASLSGATGSDMVDLGRAAGAMGNAIGEGVASGSDKANLLMNTLRVLASQGKLTAIEMDTLAKHMPKLAGASRMYSDVGKTMAEFGALGQLSMGGGAWNAASATTAMAGFTAEISSSKGAKAFKELDIQRYDPKTKMLRSPIDLIRELVEKTGGSPEKLSKVVTGTRGGRMVNWMASEYRRTGGWESTNKRVGELMNAGTLSKENIEDINTKRMETRAAKAQAFQNKLDEITSAIAEGLMPALTTLEPKILSLASTFGNVITWAAGNPWKAVMALLGASVARAGVESLGRMLLERGINGFASGAMTSPMGTLGAGTIAGGALGALALGAATFMITSAVLNASNVSMQEDKKSRAVSYNQTYQDFASEYTNAKTPEEREAALKRARANVQNVHESRGGFMNAISEDEDQKSTMAAIAKLVQTVTKGGEQPWQPGDLRASTAKEVTAQEIGANVATAMKTTQLQISGWDTLIDAIVKMGQVGNGAGGFGAPGSMGGPPVANQS